MHDDARPSDYRVFRQPLTDDDNDYDYDVYLLWTSSWPPVLFPEELESTDVLVVGSL